MHMTKVQALLVGTPIHEWCSNQVNNPIAHGYYIILCRSDTLRTLHQEAEPILPKANISINAYVSIKLMCVYLLSIQTHIIYIYIYITIYITIYIYVYHLYGYVYNDVDVYIYTYI